MARDKLFSTMVASILFIGLLVAPLLFAQNVNESELSAFTLGVSQDPTGSIENAADLVGYVINEQNPTLNGQRGTMVVDGKESGLRKLEMSTAIASNLSTNLTTFGDGYASGVIDLRATAFDANFYDCATGGAGTDCSRVAYSWNFDPDDFLGAESISFIVHDTGANRTYEAYEVVISETGPTAGGIHSLSVSGYVVADYTSGSTLDVLITTQAKLLYRNIFGDNAPATGNDLTIRFNLYADFTLMPKDGDLQIYDMQFAKTRDNLLSNENKLIAFNIGYALIGGLLVVIATPWVSFNDIFGRMGRNRRGEGRFGGALGMIAVLGLIVVAVVMFRSGGSFAGFFTASLLPLSLATMAVLLVSLTTRGKSNRGFTLAMAAIAGVLAWMLGQSIQNNWLAYDELYVAPFVNVLSGGASLTDAFALSAFFVVVVQIAGTLVALFNITRTITTDQVVSATD